MTDTGSLTAASPLIDSDRRWRASGRDCDVSSSTGRELQSRGRLVVKCGGRTRAGVDRLAPHDYFWNLEQCPWTVANVEAAAATLPGMRLKRWLRGEGAK